MHAKLSSRKKYFKKLKKPLSKNLLDIVAPDLKNVRVLLIDDSKENLILFSIWLEQIGAKYKTLDSARDVIQLLNTFKPHILLSDITMPGEDGYALIAKVRAQAFNKGGKIPAGALTANTRDEDKAAALAAGFDLHIPKPTTINILLATIRFLVELGRKKK